MSDKPQDTGLDSKSQREKDVIDYNHELAGADNGRIKRFSVDSPTYLNSEAQEKRKSKERQFTDMLSYMLANDKQYRDLYFETETKLEDAQLSVDEALLRIKQEVDDIQYQLDNASLLGLSEAQKIELKRKQDELERQRQEIDYYQRNVIEPIRQRMDDKDNPPSKDELEQFQHMLDTQKPSALLQYSRRDAPEIVPSSVAEELLPTPKEMLKMGASFNVARLGIEELDALELPDEKPSEALIPKV